VGQMFAAICGGQGISVVSAIEWTRMLDAAVIAQNLSASVTALCPILADMPFDSSLDRLELKGRECQSKRDAGSPSRNLAIPQSGFPAPEWPPSHAIGLISNYRKGFQHPFVLFYRTI
jgi:hypothetical protein